MFLSRKRAYARAGLLGNPSDGYNGKTISFSVRNYWAEVVLYEWDTVEIVLADDDRAKFESVCELARDVRLPGYYGGSRLIKATIKRFVEHCESRTIALHDRKFSIRYQTTIPRQVGLAGSSAIIVATLRCLMEFYDVQLPLEAQPMFVLLVEQDELGIAVGLQDRVIQVYEGLVYMDFDRVHEHFVDGVKAFRYEPLDPALLPPLYVAHHETLGEPTEVFHNAIRDRFDRGEAPVVDAMRCFARIAADGRDALLARDVTRLAPLGNPNFDTRRGNSPISTWQIAMVETARECGATAKFAGSGGAIVGSYDDDPMFQRLPPTLPPFGPHTRTPRPSSNTDPHPT